jgi:hypothetical protein
VISVIDIFFITLVSGFIVSVVVGIASRKFYLKMFGVLLGTASTVLLLALPAGLVENCVGPTTSPINITCTTNFANGTALINDPTTPQFLRTFIISSAFILAGGTILAAISAIFDFDRWWKVESEKDRFPFDKNLQKREVSLLDEEDDDAF